MADNPWDEFSAATPAQPSAPQQPQSSGSEWDEFETAEPSKPAEPTKPTFEAAPAPEASAAPYTGPTRDNVKPSLNGQGGKVEVVETTRTVSGFADELPTEVQSKMTPEQLAQYVALAENPNSTAADLTAFFKGIGFDLANADDIIAARKELGKVSKTIDYRGPKPPTEEATRTGAALRGVGKGVTARFLDEAGAVVDSVGLTPGRQNIWNSDLSFGDLYDRNVDMNRAIIGQDENEHPVYSYGGEIVGGLITAKPTGAAATAINAGRIGRTGQIAAEGAVTGALYGAGAADNGDRVMGALGGAVIGAGTSAAGDKVLGGMARQSGRDATVGREVLDAADDLNARHGTNIQPVAGNVGGTGSRIATAGSEQTILGGMQLTRAANKQVDEAGKAAEAIAGGARPLNETGDALLNTGNPNSLINLPTRLRERTDALYERAGTLAGNIKLATPRTLQRLDEEIARLEEVPGGVAGLDKLKELRTALANGGSVNGLRRLRTSFGDSLESGNRTVRETSKRLWGPLSDDIAEGLTAAGKKDAALAYRRADTAHRSALGHTDKVNRLLEGKSGQQVADALTNMSKNDDRLLQDILRVASPDEARAIQGGIIMRLGRAKDSVQNAAGDVFSLETFLTNYSKLTDAAKSRIFNGQLRSDLNNLAKVAEGARRGRTFRNSSNTAGAANTIGVLNRFFNLETAGRIGYGAMGGTALVGGVKGALASGTLGFLLSSPRVARILVRWGETGATRSEVISQLSRVAGRMAGSQGADAVNAFIDFLKSDDGGEAVAAPTAPAEVEPHLDVDADGMDEFDRTFGTEPAADTGEDDDIPVYEEDLPQPEEPRFEQ